MKKIVNCSEYFFQKVFGIFIFIILYNFTYLNAQNFDEAKIVEDLNVEAEDSNTPSDPSTKKAQEAAEKKQTLEELLAVPFNQIREEQALEVGFTDEKSTDNISKKG